MRPRTVSCCFALGLALGFAASALAVVVPGGKSKKSDCYAGFEVESKESTATVTGTSRANGTTSGASCTFDVALCVNEPVTGCMPANVTGFSVNTGNLPLPTLGSSHNCGSTLSFSVPLKGKKQNKPGVKRIRVVADSDGKPKKDPDTLVLHCAKCSGQACGTVPPCPANPAGGGNIATVTVANSGTDLDSGWTGTSHNFPVVGGSNLKLCLTGCDTTATPVCTINGPTGANSINTDVFGPPLPLLAANVPVCVTNRFQHDVTGTTNLQTGDVTLTVDLFSDVFLTTAGEVCPRCNNGTCTSGPNADKSCTVEGTVTVAQAAGDKTYNLSRDCPPSQATSQFAGSLPIHLPLTSGAASLAGPRPCRPQAGDPSVGVPVQDDQCGGSACNAPCGGLACQTKTSDGKCIDAKGGLSQFCCAGSTSTPCFPTNTANPANAGKIDRTGVPMPVSPAWNDPTFPKTSTGTVVSLFCIPATTSNTVNTTSGLPGPGALILPGTVVVDKK